MGTFRTPSQADIPVQRPTHTEDLHTSPVVNRVVGDEALHLSGDTAQRVKVWDRKQCEAMIQGDVHQPKMAANEFAS